MRILLTNVYDMFNKGEVILVTSLVKNLPGVEFTLAPLYSFLDVEFCKKLGIKIFGRTSPRHGILLLFWSTLTLSRAFLWSFLHKLFRVRIGVLLNKEVEAYLDANLIVDLGGDNFSDDSGFGGSLVHSYSLLFALLFNKPFIICSQSIGPFKNILTKNLARYILNRASLITVREPITEYYLTNDLKVKGNKLHLIPDLAFLLEETETQETLKFLEEKNISLDKPIICVNPSQLISKYMFSNKSNRYESYINLMADMIDKLPNNATIILIPNVVSRHTKVWGPFRNVDDNVAIELIVKKIRDKSRVYIVTDINPHYIKSVIGLSDLFIGCRMHAIISALSVGTPTVALAYSHKTLGTVGELLGLKDFVVDVRQDVSTLRHELFTKISITWENRFLIKKKLQERSMEWKQRAMVNIDLVRWMLDEIY